jgi:serine/threonine protein kinase
MGQVYKGSLIQSNGVRIDVAIKFLFDDLPAQVIERAKREASIQIHNENLVEMFGFIQIDDVVSSGVTHQHYHVVSELLHGVMLYDLLKGKTTDNNNVEIPYARELYNLYVNDKCGFAILIIKNILSGIMALHDKGYIHRDIDPSNIMITEDRKIKIIDFGIAKQLSTLNTQDQQLTSAGQFMGKAAYASPELVMGDVVHQNETTDIYAIGIIFFQLIVGHLPFDGATHEVLDMQLNKKMPLEQIHQSQIRKVIGKATEKKQIKRFQSASEFRVAVEQLEKIEFKNENEIKLPISFDFIKSKKFMLIASMVLLTIVGTVGIFMHKQSPLQPAENQSLIAARIDSLQNSVIDSYQAISVMDSLSGVKVKSSALLTEEATKDLLDPAKAENGIKTLDRVISKGYRTSSIAAYLLGRLYYEDTDASDSIQAMKTNLGSKLKQSNKKAHAMMERAVELDSTSYKALYELGCDYYAGEMRTGKSESRDIKKALEYFSKGLKYAQQAKDDAFISKCSKRIEELK